MRQYEISNFARAGFESRHNLKYWTRQPYLGFGVDAHSMLRRRGGDAPSNRTDPRQAEHSAAKRRQNAAQGASPGCAPRHWPAPLGRKNDIVAAVRFSTPDSLEDIHRGQAYPAATELRREALEEAFFLGLRLKRGVDLPKSRKSSAQMRYADVSRRRFRSLPKTGLLERRTGEVIRLTSRGRLLSNEVFERFITQPASGVMTSRLRFALLPE